MPPVGSELDSFTLASRGNTGNRAQDCCCLAVSLETLAAMSKKIDSSHERPVRESSNESVELDVSSASQTQAWFTDSSSFVFYSNIPVDVFFAITNPSRYRYRASTPIYVVHYTRYLVLHSTA